MQKASLNLFCQEEDSLFAVSTPGSEELHHPHLAALQHHLVEVVVGKFDHVLLAAAGVLLLQGQRGLLQHFHLCNLRHHFKIKNCTPVCCSPSHWSLHSASPSPDYAGHWELRPRWPGYCVHLKHAVELSDYAKNKGQQVPRAGNYLHLGIPLACSYWLQRP